MGYDDLKVIEAYRFLRSIAEGKSVGTTLDDAVDSARGARRDGPFGRDPALG